jgi:choline-sulfatase
VFTNRVFPPATGQADTIEGRCGPYLARAMAGRGYRTFGVGKFHSNPRYEDLGYETHLHTEEVCPPGGDGRDAYYRYIRERHPEYGHVEMLHGERTEMYYMPQVNPLPAELNCEAFVADRAVEQLATGRDDGRPFFGFVSFIGPHPPLAPPVPFNRLYHPDRMPRPIRGNLAVDHADEQIPWMNRSIWADEPDDLRIACCRARYYGEVTYIDWCVGRILDAVEARPDADHTMVVFFSDHGDGLGDHHMWQKENFFEQAARVPLLVSWPARLPADRRCDELACLTDLFALATGASGEVVGRDGHDQLAMLTGDGPPRDQVVGWHGEPGTPSLTMMVRRGPWKYVFIANGGREQLFNVAEDPEERNELSRSLRHQAAALREVAEEAARQPGAEGALDGDGLRSFDYEAWPIQRVYQMNAAPGFPDHPADVLAAWGPRFRTERPDAQPPAAR